MKISFFKGSKWIGDAYTDEGGSGFLVFSDWLWKTLVLSLCVGILEYVAMYLTIKIGGIDYTVLHAGEIESNSFAAKALVCGAFSFGGILITVKRKKWIIALIATCLISYGYAFASELAPFIAKLLVPFTWLVSAVFIALGAAPVYIAEHFLGIESIDAFGAGIWALGILFGMIAGTLFYAILEKAAAWYAFWE